MWEDCAVLSDSVPNGALANSQIVFDPLTNLILIGVGDATTNSQLRYMAFERTGGVPNYVGLWDGFTSHVMGMAKDGSSFPRLLHATSDGYVYAHGYPGGGIKTDEFNAGDAAISLEIIGPALGYDVDESKRFDEMSFAFRSDDDTTVTVDWETSRGIASSTKTISLTGATGLVWDVGNWDDEDWASTTVETRKRVGVRAFGRYLRPRVRHAAVDKELGVELMRVTAFADHRNPNVP
jgi:hypothetical protein